MPLQQLGAQTHNTTVGIREYGQDVNLRMTSQHSSRRAATCAASETLPLTGMVTKTGGVITEVLQKASIATKSTLAIY